MTKIRCEIHGQDIIIYEANEHDLFKDDNSKETVILINEDRSKDLKRFVAGGCDGVCLNVIKALEEES